MGIILNKEIEWLKKEMLSLSAVVEEAVGLAVRAVDESNIEYANKVIGDDREIDMRELDVEEECLKVLALHQPVAAHLRFIVAVLKITNELERVGDLAAGIGERAIMLAQRGGRGYAPFDITGMADRVRFMLKNALDSFIDFDAARAREVLSLDDEVDRRLLETYGTAITRIREIPDEADRMLIYLQIARGLERIADHATNIAEDTIYQIDGEIVRHRKNS